MASIVSIKEALGSVAADTDGRGEHVFTVTNQVARKQPVGLQVIVDGDADSSWFRIDGNTEREFDEGASYQIKVLFEVPAGTAPGDYSFKLLVYSAVKARADEDFTEGPTVGITVPAPESEPQPETQAPTKQFPWWMAAAAAGVVVAVGLGVFFLVSSGGFGSVIVGVGTDGRIYTRESLDSDWDQLATKGPLMVAVAVQEDGALLGVGRDNKLHTRKSTKTGWVAAPDKGGPPMKAVAITVDGTILTVDTKNNIHTRKTLDDTPALVGVPCCILDLAIMDDERIVAIGKDPKILWTKTAPAAKWEKQKPEAVAVISVTVMEDGTMLGVGSNDNKLWTRNTFADPWVKAPDKGRTMINVAVRSSKL